MLLLAAVLTGAALLGDAVSVFGLQEVIKTGWSRWTRGTAGADGEPRGKTG